MLVGIKVGLGDVTFGYYLTFLEVILYLSEKCPCPTCPNLKNISVQIMRTVIHVKMKPKLFYSQVISTLNS